MTIGHPQWQSVVTPALMYEYEAVVRRPGQTPALSDGDLTAILDLLYQRSHRQLVYFSWRPLSHDPGDDSVLGAAVAGGCEFVVSFNERHLRSAWDFGIESSSRWSCCG